ncbi:MAG: lipoprotein NlpI [Elusimicrobia bacterium ADurb.Bin231]|nr:MAG: lipoprotein NlpI [Elusimicrobia bacterium ADurb.Bin231]
MTTIIDLKMKLRVAYNHDISLANKIITYKNYVDSVYMASDPAVFPSSGSPYSLPSGLKKPDEDAGWVIGKLREYGIKTYLLLNATNFDPEIVRGYERSELRKYLRRMVKEYGLEKVIIFSIPLAQRIKDDFPELGLEVSTNAGVDSLEKARYWQDAVDIEGICVHQRLNKRLETLKLIKTKTGLKLSIIANNQCLINCPNEISHNNFSSYSGHGITYFPCHHFLTVRPWDVFHQARLVPANLRHFKNIVDIIKIEGRADSAENIIELVSCYAEKLDSYEYPGNYTGVWYPFYHPYTIKREPSGIFEKVSQCDLKCEDCGYCRSLWMKYYGFDDSIKYCLDAYQAFYKKDYASSAKLFKLYIATGKTVDDHLYYHFGMALNLCGELSAAASALEMAIKINSSRWIYYNLLGAVYRSLGLDRESVEALKTAVKLNAGEWSNYNILGNIYFNSGKFREAVLMFDKALSLNPDADYIVKIKEKKHIAEGKILS